MHSNTILDQSIPSVANYGFLPLPPLRTTTRRSQTQRETDAHKSH